jgi:F-type H+-transporting ATPase subunit b
MLYDLSLLTIALAPPGGGTLVDVNPGLIFWTAITFLTLLLILSKVAWKPIVAALKQRENAIQDSLEKAELAKAEAQKVLDANQANLAKAEEESRKIIEQARAYAEKMKEQIVNESREQSRKILADATAEIGRQKDAAFNELRVQVAEIAVSAAEKIIKQNLDVEANKKIVNTYISEIAKN